ncbi:hypothetical protein BVRB_2g026360 [Beta vulgaris subsp. vulgaris]|nr:hypothetical protein BVRB_2g026360 [Beta vulgaris subsp. vulgaris]
MDPPRRNTRAVIDPKIRQVGFFAPDRTHSDSLSSSSSSSPVAGVSPSGNSLSPVMIPPPRHCSDTQILLTSSRPVGPHYPAVPSSPLRRPLSDVVTSHLVVGSYNPSDIFPADSENSEDVVASPSGAGRGRKGGSKFASSLPSGGFNLMVGKAGRNGNGNGGVGGGSSSLISASGVKVATGVSEKAGEVSADAQSEPGNAKPTKEKLSKAERRALQEAQRAAKAAAKADMSKASTGASGGGTLGSSKQAKVRVSAQSKDNASVAASEKKGGDRQSEKERKKDVPHPRMQFDDKTRVEKAKKRAVVKQTEARNRVELFRHLPQYEHGTQLPDLEAKFFQLEPMHPAVYKVGLRYLTGDISGGNARCIAMLEAFQDAIRDYSTPPEKVLVRDLTARIGSYVSFLIECRPLSISMGNAIRFLKNRIAKLSLSSSESEAKASLQSDINHFISEKILIADKIGKQFRVVIVDSRPKLEGQLLLRRLVAKGLNCTYTHINAVSYSMHEVTRVFLGAASILSNGTVYSRVGTACVAMVAHAFHVPVLVCCEAYKFHERVQLDSICFNELGDPDAILKVPGRTEINYLSDWTSSENLQLLNLMYDTTPSDYISMIITDYGMIPPTSVPVIVREHRREHLWS